MYGLAAGLVSLNRRPVCTLGSSNNAMPAVILA
jgi:hypothetical protein